MVTYRRLKNVPPYTMFKSIYRCSWLIPFSKELIYTIAKPQFIFWLSQAIPEVADQDKLDKSVWKYTNLILGALFLILLWMFDIITSSLLARLTFWYHRTCTILISRGSLAWNLYIQPRRNGQKAGKVVVREHTLLESWFLFKHTWKESTYNFILRGNGKKEMKLWYPEY